MNNFVQVRTKAKDRRKIRRNRILKNALDEVITANKMIEHLIRLAKRTIKCETKKQEQERRKLRL